MKVIQDNETYFVENSIAKMGNQIYSVAIIWTECFENVGILKGNGHHIAQEIVEYAQSLVKNRIKT